MKFRYNFINEEFDKVGSFCKINCEIAVLVLLGANIDSNYCLIEVITWSQATPILRLWQPCKNRLQIKYEWTSHGDESAWRRAWFSFPINVYVLMLVTWCLTAVWQNILSSIILCRLAYPYCICELLARAHAKTSVGTFTIKRNSLWQLVVKCLYKK